MNSIEVSFITKMRKDNAIRIPKEVLELGIKPGMTLQVSVEVIERKEERKDENE